MAGKAPVESGREVQGDEVGRALEPHGDGRGEALA
jgi:hypothetical protein